MANAAPPTTPSPAPGELIPRLYQQEIFNHAVRHNVICAMDTGSGKTQIAVMLLRHILAAIPADAKPRKVAVFLVSSVPLVEQQADFLKSQLPLRVNKFYGAMGVDLWNRERWAQAFVESDVMVMTAQVFHDLLSHAHWHISKVCLIIFDEAHHCNKKHVYAQIMKTHYFYCPPQDRPRIFGMTASPIYNIRNPTQSLAQLQECMDARVLAVRDNTLELALNAPRPNEFLLRYAPGPREYPNYPSPTMWVVFEQFQDLVLPDYDDVRDLRTRFYHVREELGPLCADYFILLFLKRAMIKALMASEADVDSDTDMEDIEVVKPPPTQSWSDLDNAYNHHSDRIDRLADSLDLPRMKSWFTHKLFKLVQVLEANSGADFSAMIFVEQRQIASVLSWVLPKVPQLALWVKAAALVGHGDTGGPRFEGSGMAHAAQRTIVQDFRKGEINLVIATSVAEEGLDFQACSLVIRLDAPQTMIGYLQSRGRARKSGSNYVVLADEAGAKRYNGFREAEPALRQIYQRIHAEEDKQETFMDTDEDEGDDERYFVQSTGAVITPTSAISLLHLLCSLLTVDKYTKPPAPEFYVQGNFICTVTLPPSILKPSVCGPIQGGLRKTRDGARRSAAFEMVKKLHQLEMFDDYLMPFRKNAPVDTLGTRQPQGKVQRIGEYFETMSTWGDIWQPNSPVWMNELSFNGSEPRIALVSAKPQPAHDLTIYKREGPQHVKLYRSRQLEFSSERERLELLEGMQRYTYCAIFWSITARKLPPRSTCLIIPLKAGLPDYDTMAQVDSQAIKLTKEEWLDPALQGRHVMEAHRLGSQVYKFVAVKPGLSLSSAPVAPDGAETCRESEFEDYRAYWEKTTNTAKRGVELEIPEDDCWLELSPTTKADFRSQGLYGLVDVPNNDALPSKLAHIFTPSHIARICPLPADIVESCQHFPNILGQLSVLLRIDTSYDVLKTRGVPFELLLMALTLPAVQAGFDYQRLETLGDSVLKVSTCAHLFLKYPNHHEGQLTAIKDSIVSNANLMVIGKNGPLSKFLITERTLTRKTWRPPASSTMQDDSNEDPKEEGEDEVTQATFHTKSLADCTEATLGAAYLSLGIDSALRVGEALGLPIGGAKPWRLRNLPTFRERAGVPVLFAPIEEKLGYKFINDSLVVEAFTHTAYDPTKGPSYNRLEFLGDSLLDLYVLEYMYKKYDKMTPGQMSWARSRLVNCTTFGKLGVELGLHKCILTSSASLQKAITSFAAEVENISLSEILVSCWKIDAPKPISDMFESIFGAVFVDTSFDLQQTFTVIERVMSDIMQFITPNMPGDPTSELIRWVAGQGCEAQGTTIFRSSASSEKKFGAKDTVETVVHGRTIAKVTEPTAKLARPKAAQVTLDILKDTTHDYALSKICTCPRAILKRTQLATNGLS